MAQPPSVATAWASQRPVAVSQAKPAAHSSLLPQLERHAPSAHANGAQSYTAVAVSHEAPAPLQVEGPFSVLGPVQTLGAHWSPARIGRQAPEPHVVEHLAASHSFRRSSPGSAVQVPTRPGTTQEWHFSLHARSQQTPSEQCPVAHSPSTVQRRSPPGMAGAPASVTGGTQAPDRHEVPVAQSVSLVQLVAQPVPLHAYGAQDAVVTSQAPDAPQAAVVATPSEQVGFGHAIRAPWGAPVTAPQVPGALGRSHASHWPAHARSQHAPSTQNPLAHSEPAPHLPPRVDLPTHAPVASQRASVAQSASVVHLAAQAPATHA